MIRFGKSEGMDGEKGVSMVKEKEEEKRTSKDRRMGRKQTVVEQGKEGLNYTQKV